MRAIYSPGVVLVSVSCECRTRQSHPGLSLWDLRRAAAGTGTTRQTVHDNGFRRFCLQTPVARDSDHGVSPLYLFSEFRSQPHDSELGLPLHLPLVIKVL